MSVDQNIKARDFLIQNILQENILYFGAPKNARWRNRVVDAWMDDQSNPRWRYELINEFIKFKKGTKILDMASGCGTFVFYGLLNGHDAYGIDPEDWKHTFCRLKAAEYGYPDEWIGRFHKGVGEFLPYKDNFFDCVSSYQTLEHVQDPQKCIFEMCRVTRVGGCVHIMCPDYRSTYEGHYLLPWLPLFPRQLARIYLKLLGKSTKCLDGINYTTTPKIYRWLKEIENEMGWSFCILDYCKRKFEKALLKRKIPLITGSYLFYQILIFIRQLFRKESSTNIFVLILKK